MRADGVPAVKFRDAADETRPSVAAVVAEGQTASADWLVSGADGALPNRIERFTGAGALLRSLRYAHDEYSRVRWLMN